MPYEESAKRVQEALNKVLGQGLKVDGYWGNATQDAWEILLSRAAAGVAGAPALPESPPAAGGIPALESQPKAERFINEVIIHCTATPESREVSLDTIRRWHKARGFSDIGYHYVVHINGLIEAGRQESLIGAHVEGHNTGTIGISYVGGCDANMQPKDTRTEEQKKSLMGLVLALKKRYPTIMKVSGHNQYASKACPSFDVRKDPLGSAI